MFLRNSERQKIRCVKRKAFFGRDRSGSLFADVSLIYQNLDSINFFFFTWGSLLFHYQKQRKESTVQHFRVSVQEYRTQKQKTDQVTNPDTTGHHDQWDNRMVKRMQQQQCRQ
jgi:hypothetical protein